MYSMKQDDLIKHFVNGDIDYIDKKASSLFIESDYDSDNMTLWSYGIKIAEKDLLNEEITIWGWANYYSTTTCSHISKLKGYLYDNEIGYIVNNEHPNGE